jgi:hypothetical protein
MEKATERITVSVSFRLADLKRLDTWKDERRQTRSAAIMSLLDLAEGSTKPRWDTEEQLRSEVPSSPSEASPERALRKMTPDMLQATIQAAEEEGDVAMEQLERGEVKPAGAEEFRAELSRLEKARVALARAEAGENAGALDPPAPTPPQKLKKPDTYSQVEEWDSDGVAQDPPGDDVDQTRRRR